MYEASSIIGLQLFLAVQNSYDAWYCNIILKHWRNYKLIFLQHLLFF